MRGIEIDVETFFSPEWEWTGVNLVWRLLQEIGKSYMSVQNKMGWTVEICKPESCVLLAAGGCW
jgi:hypothetical protein